MLTKAQKKYSGILIKMAVLLFAGWYIYQQLSDPNNLLKFKTLIDGIDPHYLWSTLGLIVTLMLINWILEVFKWQYLSRRIERISFWTAFQSVFCGLTWAIFTPNRIGEYGGRVLFLKPENRAKGAVGMGVGLFAQLVLTSIAGSLSIAWFACTYLDTPLSIEFGIWLLAVLYASGFLILYFNVNWIDSLVGRIKFLKRIKPFFSILEEYSFKELLIVILISLARFIIFTSQYIILMLVILPQLPFVAMILMIFILFFVQAALPTLDIFDFSVRSFVAGNLYSYITNQELAVMAIVSCIWFVNLILPAVLGSVFVLKINFFGDSKS
ncbi:lysylphosphatidylglycerol synthase domain-containing protein [Sphingobacterium sp. SRCM116780]|uniref:lysylphosphatidylglycerol synthase domain-containing protein n=1 Tax=Sphingobacterium sp. SRCM116780 TaxID=2907623 RepID=UPI001F2D4964|nr:lysylphosphatidylglycerol synthase domain-containing protein [Sphingobacterium sp. SRCM116780]UIR55424.1 lysylphosphatidylglycerol synthase domain-containing protein [Sphingobacterium sp. SRCM116780]